MPAQLRILDSDGTTVITSENFGNIATPGSSASTKFFVQNFGTSAALSVTIGIEAIGTNDGEDYTQIAEDIAGAPGTFGQTDLSLGTIAPLASVPFWVRVVQPAGLTADNNPRRANIVADALTI